MNPIPRETFEAFLSCCFEVSDVIGTNGSIRFALAAILIAILRQWKEVRSYLLIGLVFLAIGLGVPELINWILAWTAASHATQLYTPIAIFFVVFLIVIVLTSLSLMILPVYVARKRGKTRMGILLTALLTVLSLLFYPLWSIALFFAHIKEKDPVPDESTAS